MLQSKNKIDVILADIFQCCLKQYDALPSCGLLDGKLGVLVYLLYYKKYVGTAEVDIIVDRLWDSFLAEIPFETMNYDYANGICGLLYTLHVLYQNGISDVDPTEAADQLSSHILFQMRQRESLNYSYDLFYGLTGAGIFATEMRNNEILSFVINSLEQNSIICGECIKWKHVDLRDRRNSIVNISMPHGMSSIIILLAKVYQKKPEKKLFKLITGAINYLLSQEIDTKIFSSMFPMTSKESQQNLYSSRLAWCYGDLCPALALWIAGKTLSNDKWQEKAIQIFLHNAKRREESDTLVFDGILCHGSAGIAQIYRRMFFETNLIEFKNTATYWDNRTIEYGKNDDGFAGYKTARHAGTFNSIGLLEGIAGIGLSLLSSISTALNSTWDKLLLIS